jgi:hypothetical protein
MEYEVGHTYVLAGKPKICERWFHFCRNPVDVLEHYPRRFGNRFCEVRVWNHRGDGTKSVCSRLKVIREFSEAEWDELCNEARFNDCSEDNLVVPALPKSRPEQKPLFKIKNVHEMID